MAGARTQIRELVGSRDPFDQPTAEIRGLQLEAARECFADLRERIPLLRRRADETGVTEITGRGPRPAAVLPHQLQVLPDRATSPRATGTGCCAGTRRCRWSSPSEVDIEGVTDIDGWIERITAAGHRPYITSGTSGKVSFLNCNVADRRFRTTSSGTSPAGPIRCPPKPTRRAYLLAPASGPMRSIEGFNMHADVFGPARSSG